MNKLFVFILLSVFATTSLAQSSQDQIRETAFKLTQQHQYVEAAEEFGKLVTADPENASLHLQLAAFHLRAKDMDRFIADVERAVKLKPDDETIVMGAVRTLQGQGKPDLCSRALKIVDTYLEGHKESHLGYHFRFFIDQCLGDRETAYKDISRAIELAPNLALYQSNRANLVSLMGDSALAIKTLQELIRSMELRFADAPQDPNALAEIKRELSTTHNQLSLAYERSGNREAAVDELTRAIKYSPDPYIQIRAAMYRRFKMFPEAIADYTTAIRAAEKNEARMKAARPDMPLNHILFAERADTYLSAGMASEAIEDYQECIRRDPPTKPRFDAKIATARQKQAEKP